MTISPAVRVVLDVKTVNEANGSHGHWRPKAARRKAQRNLTRLAMLRHPKPLPCTVLLTRLSAGTLDDDAVPLSLKSIRDGIADAFGVKDNDPRIAWRYAQAKARRGQYAVVIEITEEPMPRCELCGVTKPTRSLLADHDCPERIEVKQDEPVPDEPSAEPTEAP